MARKPFDKSEITPVGQYPGIWGRPGAPKYDRPITSKENTLLYFEGKKPYWIPILGFGGEVLSFRPRMHPDNVATHLVVDGEEPMQYELVTKGWFDLDWVYVPHVGGATVKPGDPLITDMNEWKNITKIPDINELDWEGTAERNKEYLSSTDSVLEVCALSGLWERLISLMDVEGAAIALIDEDQKEAVHSFFSELCDMYDDMITRYKKYFDMDMYLMHDDWGTQNAPFFSLETAREMLVPYLKRIVDSCHKNGVIFELHCCGQCEELVPAMIEAGVDIWCGQTLNDYEKLSALYPDTCLTFGMGIPMQDENATEEELMKAAEEFVEVYKDRRVVINPSSSDPRMLMKVYEASRKYYAQFDE
ncbi:MAG: hypothetical protein E7218_04460 [Anaerofustis stercorihominis]|nr:hypothetical protein [Anaerofustis stercorihominis]